MSKEDWESVRVPALADRDLTRMRPLREADPELYALVKKRTATGTGTFAGAGDQMSFPTNIRTDNIGLVDAGTGEQ